MYCELHARSAFSFLRGGSLPEDLIAAAMAVECPAMALLDRDGVYGAPRFFASAQENNFAVRPRVGAEITLLDGSVVPLLVATRTGYQNLCQLITAAKLTARPPLVRDPWTACTPDARSPLAGGARCPQRAGGAPVARESASGSTDARDRKRPCFATWDELAQFSTGLIALTGDEDGPVRRAWRTAGAGAADAALRQLAA